MGTGGKKTIGIAEYVLKLRDEMTGTVQNIAGGMQSMMGPAMVEIGMMAGQMGDTIIAALEDASREAISFEDAFSNVRKTIDATEAEYAALNSALREMSTQMPVSANQLAEIAAMAGQLGIKKENIIEFTKTIADLGVASNLAGEEGAQMLARFANITQMPQDQFRNLGSAIVDLGNNSASTEAEIASMALRIAGAGNIIGMTEGDILGVATALSSVGIEAEAGGSSISKIMIDIASSASGGMQALEAFAQKTGLTKEEAAALAPELEKGGKTLRMFAHEIGMNAKELQGMAADVVKGGESIQGFAYVAGMSADEFAAKWKTAPAEALTLFVEGLQKVHKAGGDVFGTLAMLDITEIRARDSMLRLAGAGDILRDSIKLGNDAFAENTALTEEANKKYATMDSQLKILQGNKDEFWRLIGETMLPLLRELVPITTELVKSLADWVRANPDLATTLVSVVGGVGLLGKAVGILAGLFSSVVITKAAMTIAGIGTAATAAVGTGGVVTTGAGGVGLAGLAVSALAVGASFVAMVAGIAVAAAGILSIGVSAVTTAGAYMELYNSNQRLSASLETYMDKLEAKGAVIDRDKVRSMEHGEAMQYLAEREAAAGDSLLRAYIANVAGRMATDEEFARAKNMLLNENVSREEAAYLATLGHADSFYMEIMQADKDLTQAYMEELGLRGENTAINFVAIKDLSTDLALEQIAINKKATEDIERDQQTTVTNLGTIWNGLITALSNAWSKFMSMLSGAANWVADNVGIPGMATGGMITGSGLVNVHKDELLLLPRGAEVVPKRHSESVRQAMEGGGGGGVTININGPVVRQDSDIDAIARKVSQAIAGSSRSSMRRVGLQPNYGA